MYTVTLVWLACAGLALLRAGDWSQVSGVRDQVSGIRDQESTGMLEIKSQKTRGDLQQCEIGCFLQCFQLWRC